MKTYRLNNKILDDLGMCIQIAKLVMDIRINKTAAQTQTVFTFGNGSKLCIVYDEKYYLTVDGDIPLKYLKTIEEMCEEFDDTPI